MEKTSRFNYIKRGIVGVCAATMLTGLCAGAAFAAPVDVTGSGEQTSSTPVTVDAKDLQVSVTLPTAVPVAVSGNTVTVPNNLQIDSTGKASVKVTKIQATNPITDLVFSASKDSLAANNMYFSVEGNAIDKDGVTPTTAIPIDSAIALEADFGTLSGSVLTEMLKGTTAAPTKLFDLTWTISLDAATV